MDDKLTVKRKTCFIDSCLLLQFSAFIIPRKRLPSSGLQWAQQVFQAEDSQFDISGLQLQVDKDVPTGSSGTKWVPQRVLMLCIIPPFLQHSSFSCWQAGEGSDEWRLVWKAQEVAVLDGWHTNSVNREPCSYLLTPHPFFWETGSDPYRARNFTLGSFTKNFLLRVTETY